MNKPEKVLIEEEQDCTCGEKTRQLIKADANVPTFPTGNTPPDSQRVRKAMQQSWAAGKEQRTYD